MKKEKINAFDCAERIAKALPAGILLNTDGDRFNSMVIGWGGLGTIWGQTVFTAFVRESRYTKAQIDKTGEFTVSAPLEGGLSAEVMKVCGSLSGRDTDKAAAAHLTLTAPDVIRTRGIAEYPLTLECEVLYSQEQDLSAIPEDVRGVYYPRGAEGGDLHTMYIAKVVSAYILRD